MHKTLLQRFNGDDNYDLYEDLRYNIQSLLNSRLRYKNLPITLNEISNSLIVYGLSDFMSLNYGTDIAQKKLCSEIENVILLFEPRISAACVSIQNETEDISRILKLKIEAKLKNFLEEKLAVFESSVDLNRHKFVIPR